MTPSTLRRIIFKQQQDTTKIERKIYKNNPIFFVIFTISPSNFFLSILAKHKVFSLNYPYLQSKSNFSSPP